ncbi:MAG TPA: DUF86 domain-containing protein [Polyangiaceae bacterium]
MTDPDLLAKRLALIETLVRELRTLARPSEIANDVREERFVEHTLQLAVQAAIDTASHVVSDGRLGEPATNQELFALLARGGWLEPALAKRMGQAAGFRNVLVHGYASVDLGIVRHVLEHGLDDLLAFVEAIRRRM